MGNFILLIRGQKGEMGNLPPILHVEISVNFCLGILRFCQCFLLGSFLLELKGTMGKNVAHLSLIYQ